MGKARFSHVPVASSMMMTKPRPPKQLIRQPASRVRQVGLYSGPSGLVESALAMKDMPERAALVIMGNSDPKFLAKLHGVIEKHDLDDRVYVLDPVPSDDLAAVLQCADVGLMLTSAVCLSYFYGLGNKMFHYVNAGVPVLTAEHPEKARFVRKHGVGVTVEAIERGRSVGRCGRSWMIRRVWR